MKYQKTVLPNGLRVVTSRMEHVRSATLVIYVGVGSRYERAGEAGISHFLEHMVFKGTAKRPDPALISQEIEGVGGILNASTGKESTNYWVKVPSAHLKRSFDVLADMLRHSLFTPEEIDKERGVIVEEIRGVEDTPDELVHDAIDELIWPGDPLGRPISGWESTVAAIDRDLATTVEQVPDLPGYNVYRPADLGATGASLPVAHCRSAVNLRACIGSTRSS